ncbi:MAG TPA: nucleotidyltransferase family protein [candidate division Zixibacteria bacterium]|nr:nucleotidyltransferase family protein [candidate division Zixibacteria bacterium]
MKAMILAAGLGTRLRPLTNDRPKALVEVNGRTLLEITLARLRDFGIRDVIVNVHHFADLVVEHLRANNNFGINIEVSREDDQLLDTGGGLKKAAEFFLRDGSDEAFILHNVDVLSSIDLAEMVRQHRERSALATLAVQQRDSSRQLLFERDGQLCGRCNGHDASPEMVRKCSHAEQSAFCGIHVISTRIFSLMNETGVFPIIPVYLRLASAGEKIYGFPADKYYWRDLGTAASLERAAEDSSNGAVALGPAE